MNSINFVKMTGRQQLTATCLLIHTICARGQLTEESVGYMKFTGVSTVGRASTRIQARRTTGSRAPEAPFKSYTDLTPVRP